MSSKKNSELPLDKFINLSLYNKKFGYYMKKNPFGKEGDFITAPNISRLFSEMIAIWVYSFWTSLGSPNKFNLIELGAGNGEMMKDLTQTLKNFPDFMKSCNFIIHEKSPLLIKIQKNKLKNYKISWISKITNLKKNPCIFLGNEFFDSIPIKQFFKIKNSWYEKFVNFEDKKKPFFIKKKFDMKKFEKKINFKISKNQNFIEYSKIGMNYLNDISKIIIKNSGGMLIIDYGYLDKRMKNTLQSVSSHKFSNVLGNIGSHDITYDINFSLFKKVLNQFSSLKNILTTQREFLINIGIRERAEIISKNLNFLKKADIFYRVNRLIDNKQMGNMFKVMLIKNKKNKFNLGF